MDPYRKDAIKAALELAAMIALAIGAIYALTR
jgi:hypothetical protein